MPPLLRSRADLHALLGLRRPTTTAPRAELGPPWPHPSEPAVSLRRLTLSADGEDVPCLVLVPPGPGPWPGVVAVHQHDRTFGLGKCEPAGLAGDPTMAYGLALARAGALVVVPDLRGFEERGPGRVDGAHDPTAEQLDAFALLTAGTTLQARHVEDVALCVSWLVEQDYVVGRPGVIGHSLGGQVAFFALACDDRLAAGVVSCGLGTLASLFAARVLHNPAWYVPGLVAAGDTVAVAGLVRGQRARVLAGESDPLFPVDGVRAAVAGFAPGVAELRLLPGGHGLPPDELTDATAWLLDALA